MRRLVVSRGYQRFRVVVGGVAVMLGATIVVRTAHAVGPSLSALPAYVMGGAMIALGILRARDYRTHVAPGDAAARDPKAPR